MTVDFGHLKRYILPNDQQADRPERRNDMNSTFSTRLDSAVISFGSQARAYFAGQYYYAYFYYYGMKNINDLTGYADC